jgi:hypothetical protein
MINIPNHYYLVASMMMLILVELQKESKWESLNEIERKVFWKNVEVEEKRNEKELAGWLRDIEEEGSSSGSGDTYFPSLRQCQHKAKGQH